jgi:hypothetical protein
MIVQAATEVVTPFLTLASRGLDGILTGRLTESGRIANNLSLDRLSRPSSPRKRDGTALAF